jgi:large conductance mechanosensitive channel
MAEEEKRKTIRTGDVTVTLPVLKAPHWIQGFIDFIREQGVVGLAVGLILGLASKSVVDSFVKNIINPIVGVILGGNSLTSQTLCIQTNNGVCSSTISYGQFLSDILSFIIILAIVYFVVKGLKLDRLSKKKEEK